jgi:lysylphosphatidylglycerol synthetase-like protein (DUF2156 family)
MAVGFTGTILNQFLKLACRVPRPWVLDPNFTILEQAREAASGYSFPSGHTQFAVGTFGSICATEKNKWIKVICIALMVLVPFSRMYVGVHTPADVLVGAGMALFLVWLMNKPVMASGEKTMKLLIGGMIALALVFLAYVELWQFPADIDPHNLESGMKNAYTMVGCLLGVAIVYVVDTKYLKFDTRAIWWAQMIKAGLGLVVVLAVKSVLKAPLDALFAGHMAARGLRYFFVVLTAGILWPMTFKWFQKLSEV